MADQGSESTAAVTSDAGQAPASAPSAPSTPAPYPTASPIAEGSPKSTGDSTPVQGKPKKPSLLDAVLKVVPLSTEPDVLANKGETEGGAPKPQTVPVEGQAATADQTTDDGSESDDEQPPAEATPVIRKKINKLLRQRAELRNQVATLTPNAEIGGQLSTFARENDLGPNDIVAAMSMSAAVRRGDWAGFYKQVSPYVRRAQEYLGLVLPDDLGQRVQGGAMSEEAARELARARFDQQRAQLDAQVTRERVATQSVQFMQADVQRAVSSFEERIAANDPDYRAKADAIRRATQAILYERGGTINSVKEALDIVQAAHTEVTAQFRKLMPAPRATNPTPNGYSQQPNVRAAPKTMMEAALLGLENSRRERRA